MRNRGVSFSDMDRELALRGFSPCQSHMAYTRIRKGRLEVLRKFQLSNIISAHSYRDMCWRISQYKPENQ
jgi:hypothetical protein